MTTEVKSAAENKTETAAVCTGSDETTPTGSDDGAEVGVYRCDPVVTLMSFEVFTFWCV